MSSTPIGPVLTGAIRRTAEAVADHVVSATAKPGVAAGPAAPALMDLLTETASAVADAVRRAPADDNLRAAVAGLSDAATTYQFRIYEILEDPEEPVDRKALREAWPVVCVVLIVLGEAKRRIAAFEAGTVPGPPPLRASRDVLDAIVGYLEFIDERLADVPRRPRAGHE
ncbi:hypothetical protein [Neoroseomonas soli]|uniref:Uncharacterized protein n=1 Tax=Neoroseomonas soli TaxID=1081025 RepID=A0A9X9X279_9PROT|nr:hypothetical protein [Neoroseomonas soli]MBR0673508.1 hypothetical protein [Neoroseomonas soli]